MLSSGNSALEIAFVLGVNTCSPTSGFNREGAKSCSRGQGSVLRS